MSEFGVGDYVSDVNYPNDIALVIEFYTVEEWNTRSRSFFGHRSLGDRATCKVQWLVNPPVINNYWYIDNFIRVEENNKVFFKR